MAKMTGGKSGDFTVSITEVTFAKGPRRQIRVEIDGELVRIPVPMPVLMLSGEKSIGPLKLTDAELEKTLPNAKRVWIRDATHGMWYENPDECSKALANFLQAN